MCGHTACAQLNEPVRLTRRSRSQSSATAVVELADVVERAGVVDEDVDRAELLHHPRHGGGDLLAVGHVAAERERAAAEARISSRGRLRVDHPLRARDLREDAVAVGLLAAVGLDQDVGDDDVGAGARERQRVGAARGRASRR